MKWIMLIAAAWCALGALMLIVSYLRSKSDTELWGKDFDEIV